MGVGVDYSDPAFCKGATENTESTENNKTNTPDSTSFHPGYRPFVHLRRLSRPL